MNRSNPWARGSGGVGGRPLDRAPADFGRCSLVEMEGNAGTPAGETRELPLRPEDVFTLRGSGMPGRRALASSVVLLMRTSPASNTAGGIE
jgi:hypothetical protein